MNLFGKGKGDAGPAARAPVFSPIDRAGLLGLLDQVVNTGQSGVLELHEPRGNWVYAFQGGALTHASGGRVRGARQAFDLLWEFQAGEFMFVPGVNPNLAGNLYIDKGRLLDLLRRSQAVLQGPSAPYIPPGQQRPIAPVNRPYSPPNPGQMPPQWQPGAQPPQAPGWPPAGQAGMPQAPAWAPGYAPQPGYPPAQYPGAPAPGQPYPSQAYPGAPAYPGYPQQAPGVPQAPMPPQAMPQPPMPAMPQPPMPQAPPQAYPQPPFARPAAPQPFAVQPPASPTRPVTPQSFSVPPMAIPRKQVPAYQPAPSAPAPAPAPEPAKPKDDLAALRASLVAQAPAVRRAPAGTSWGVRKADGTIATPAPAAGVKSKGKAKDKSKRGDSKFMAALKIQLIKFLLWACERKYSPDDHWTLKDAFEVSTMELRDQFFSAFSQTAKTLSSKNPRGSADDDMDDMTAGRMRGRGRRH